MKKHLHYLEYLLPIIIGILIFGKNMFKPLLFVDYTYPTFFTLPKLMSLNDYTTTMNLFHLLQFVFVFLKIPEILFQFSIIISFIISFYYIKHLLKDKIHYLLFSFIYFFNPFVYSRIMIGQVGVLLAYLFIPVFIYYLFGFFNILDKKSFIKMILAFSLSSLFSIHFFVINFIIFLIASFLYYIKYPKIQTNKKIKKYFLLLLYLILLLILLNSFWLQGYFIDPMTSQINEEHIDFFSPKMSENIPAVAKITSMWGFWRESGYTRTFNLIPIPLWYIMVFILVLLLTISFLNAENKKEKYFFFTLFWLGLILGTGISHPYFASFFDYIYKHVPLFNGFRDSHKFVSLIALSYAYFIPLLLLKIKQYKKFYFISSLIFMIVFILAFTFPLIFLNNQLKSVEYPSDYYGLNDYLNMQDIKGNIIYLPWQNYLTYNWTINTSSDGRIGVPINNIIKKQVLVGSDAWGKKEIFKQNISDCLDNNNTSCLSSYEIEYIIHDKCAMFPIDYSWLDNNESTLVLENNCISLYKLNIDDNIKKNQDTIPLRFIIGSLISLITLIAMIYILIKK
jgi:hypothetical protein